MGKWIDQRDDEVLVFLETLGLLTRQRILNEDMVWSEFCWEVVRYYAALTRDRNQITHLREASHDKTLYAEFEWLSNRLLELDCLQREVSREVVIPNQAEISNFLDDEIALVP
jgi:3-deoxy-D-arabino-heptulosonate 7-phosphate (DAHP) synthase class II